MDPGEHVDLEEFVGLLESAAEGLEEEIARLGSEFATYRRQHRRQVWEEAKGETWPVLGLPNGKIYEEVAIRRISEVGAEFSHKTGMARIAAPDLPPDWQERFRWDDEERLAALRREEEEQRSLFAGEVIHAPGVEPLHAGASAEELERARRDVRTWASRVAILRVQLNQAEAKVRQGLGARRELEGVEVWSVRANRLSDELTRATVSHLRAREWLGKISPVDPVLRGR